MTNSIGIVYRMRWMSATAAAALLALATLVAIHAPAPSLHALTAAHRLAAPATGEPAPASASLVRLAARQPSARVHRP